MNTKVDEFVVKMVEHGHWYKSVGLSHTMWTELLGRGTRTPQKINTVAGNYIFYKVDALDGWDEYIELPKEEDQQVTRVVIDSITAGLVDTLKKHAKVSKTNEIICNGISILAWAVRSVREGKRIASYDPETSEVELFTMPVLERVKND